MISAGMHACIGLVAIDLRWIHANANVRRLAGGNSMHTGSVLDAFDQALHARWTAASFIDAPEARNTSRSATASGWLKRHRAVNGPSRRQRHPGRADAKKAPGR